MVFRVHTMGGNPTIFAIISANQWWGERHKLARSRDELKLCG